jgi:acetyl esterase/lipase
MARGSFPHARGLIRHGPDLTCLVPQLASKAAVDPLIHKEYLNELADAYLPAGMDRKDPRVSPLYADLRNFPPMLIQVGSTRPCLMTPLDLPRAPATPMSR